MIHPIFYQVGEYQTHSKVDAARLARGDFDRVHFHWFEDLFGKISWARPTRTWDDLLKLRCQQLRDQYSWLSLWFSGGWDSTTILNTFIKHGIELDEIFIYDRTYFQDPEPKAALHYASQVKKDFMPNVTITFVEMDRHSPASVYRRMGQDWILSPGSSVQYAKIHRYHMHHQVDVTASQLQKRASRGEIHAQDKPRVLLADGIWYNFSADAGMYQYMQTDCEFFYISENLPELHVAQCHMAIDFFESNLRSKGASALNLCHDLQGNRFLDQRWAIWNQAIGRSCIDHASCRFGLLKNKQAQTPFSHEGSCAINAAEGADSKAIAIWRQGIHDIADITGLSIPKLDPKQNNDWLPARLSKWWPVRALSQDLMHLQMS